MWRVIKQARLKGVEYSSKSGKYTDIPILF